MDLENWGFSSRSPSSLLTLFGLGVKGLGFRELNDRKRSALAVKFEGSFVTFERIVRPEAAGSS